MAGSAGMRDELTKIIVAQVKRTFKVMFNVDVEPVSDLVFDFTDDDQVSKTELRQAGVTVVVRFAFSRAMLRPLLEKIYSPEITMHKIAYEDAACEIANIVCGGLKAFLNQNGYNLTMEPPKIDRRHIEKMAAAEYAD